MLKECAALFQQRRGVPVEVLRAGPETLAQKVGEDGDLYYAGAEYMLEEFDRLNPGVLDLASVQRLSARRVGILVRKGNPRGIKGIEDLRRGGIKVLRVTLEDMTELHEVPGAADLGFWRVAYTGQEGAALWRSDRQIDAWITYKSWYARLAADADFVDLPGKAAVRCTPIAITLRSPHRETAREFIAFLKSPEALQIFRRHGWD